MLAPVNISPVYTVQTNQTNSIIIITVSEMRGYQQNADIIIRVAAALAYCICCFDG